MAAAKPAPRKRSYKQEREYQGMETAILKAEAEVERLEAESSDPVMTTDHVRAAETFQALSMAQELVRRLYARWAELEE
jgi:ATP-binding cassette subfamily F protein uup